ncbi:mucoidy inhibitor MuiA family protein [Sulfurivermis fontis]|uniref:mucoidy inhibitor MuiA family protein n=1 Tax=Sulfurivermis fontis TaxID=1972068 RepID=UPI000FDC8AF5|nr:mucoidy inhibitor MuiA family protein [Sulfurivermis fontis]
MARKTLLLVPLLFVSLPLVARDIPSTSTVSAVTVYPDRAQVTRQVKLELPAGSHTVLIANLPPRLIEQSLQVRGQGNGRLLIGAVEARRVFSTQLAGEREQKLAETLRALQDDRAVLDGRRQALDTQAAFIEKLAQLPATPNKDHSNTFAPEKWPAAWQAIGNGMAETNKARVALQRELRLLDEQIKKTEQELDQIRSGRKDSLTAAIHVEAAQAGAASFELSYQTPGASWSPVYDARLATESRAVQLTQAAWVRQASGEDWKDVALTLSTARPAAGAAMPELAPWWIDFQRSRPAAQRALREMSAVDMMASKMAETPEMAAEELEATADVSEFAVSYRVPGKVSVASDNARQRFVLGKQDIAVQLAARSAPRLDSRAFLYAEFDYAGEAPLLPGTWRLTRDDTYVGEVEQAALRPGAHLALAFGNDDAVEVQHHVVKDERGEKGVFNKDNRVERRYRIEVYNRHRIALPVTIYDQLPVARDEQIKVALSEDTTPPTQRDVDNRSGVLAWKQELKPQGKQVIQFGYSVSFPQGRDVPGF